MDDTRLMLTDATWGCIAAVLREVKHPAGAPPKLSDREFVEAMLFLARTGVPWRDLPGRFGAWEAVFFDSTVIRAHAHAAGAPRKRGAPRRRAWAAAGAGTRPSCTWPRRTRRRHSPPC